MNGHVRYRFGAFLLSPRQRTLVRDGQALPLIPKYFDVLLLLVRRREEAVSKADIFDAVWSDVVVSDGALSQAVRTLRRVLEDEAREPRYIRTVSRHGYQFVWRDVVEEADEGSPPPASPAVNGTRPVDVDAVERLVDQLIVAAAAGADAEDDARDFAARLHLVGTSPAVARLTARPNHARALALMREARWSVPSADAVPLLVDGEAGAAVLETVRLRLRAARSPLLRRWGSAVGAGTCGGAVAGGLGGAVLMALPSRATWEAPVALAAIGALAGAAGAAGLGAGLSMAEAAARSRRFAALVTCAAVCGAAAGLIAHVVVRAVLQGLFGVLSVSVAGVSDGLVLGVAAGLGYAVATRSTPGGALAAPSGSSRVITALVVGGVCALGAVALSLAGHQLVGGLIHDIARATASSQLVLAPLGRLLGEPEFGPLTRALLAAFEGGALGAATTWGLTMRPSPRS